MSCSVCVSQYCDVIYDAHQDAHGLNDLKYDRKGDLKHLGSRIGLGRGEEKSMGENDWNIVIRVPSVLSWRHIRPCTPVS